MAALALTHASMHVTLSPPRSNLLEHTNVGDTQEVACSLNFNTW